MEVAPEYMTLFIQHRINNIELLRATPREFGLEVDLRSSGNRIICHHDPFIEGIDFLEWLTAFEHSTLILNVKEDGLEQKIEELLKSRGIENYLFLDQAFPTLSKRLLNRKVKSLIRVSEFESTSAALNLGADWVWLDSHTGDWSYLVEGIPMLKEKNIKVCLASPSLHGRKSDQEMEQIKEISKKLSFKFDGICGKDVSEISRVNFE
jgi:hypothetical protein